MNSFPLLSINKYVYGPTPPDMSSSICPEHVPVQPSSISEAIKLLTIISGASLIINDSVAVSHISPDSFSADTISSYVPAIILDMSCSLEPVLHSYVYIPVPPSTSILINPSLPPLHEISYPL